MQENTRVFDAACPVAWIESRGRAHEARQTPPPPRGDMIAVAFAAVPGNEVFGHAAAALGRSGTEIQPICCSELEPLYLIGYNQIMKPVYFLGDSLRRLREFPEDARHDAGYQLDKVQRGEQPDDFKPMTVIGMGVEEIRVADDSGAYRVIYFARRADAVFVLHTFQKKTQATSRRDMETAKRRFEQLSRGGI
ncbi:MAG: type II toxin-antitoxin system RelE/ParE family toxin [Acidobacteriales bacterium]|nr:type II toxin-antitoxin system RelE/ParE family toxin [Terriglobales bacterium]